MFEIRGTITGYYACDIQVFAYKMTTGELVGGAIVKSQSNIYSITVGGYQNECFLVFVPQIGKKWTARQFNAVGDFVYPTAPASTPYYYICTGAGYSADNEPLFTNNALTTIKDGATLWQLVERIPTPIVSYPITPHFY